MQNQSKKAIAQQIAKTHTEMRLKKLARLERAIDKYFGDDGINPIMERFIDFSQDILTGYHASQMGRKYCADASFDLARAQQFLIRVAIISEKAEK